MKTIQKLLFIDMKNNVLKLVSIMRLLFLIILPIYACNSQKADNTDYKLYEAEAVGWTTRFPGTWKVMTEDEIAKLEGRGQAAMESTIDEKIVFNHINLLWLKKDQFNSFTSNSQPFDTIADGSYKENQELINRTLTETYRSQGIQFDVKFGVTKIDGLEFSTMETVLYFPGGKKILLNQIMYDRLINGTTSLTLNINYNNENDKTTLLDIINASKLLKRE